MRIPATAPKISPEGELATLQDYLTHYRRTLLMKCESLNAEQLAVGQPRRRPCRCSVCSGTSPRQSGTGAAGSSLAPPTPKLYGAGDADFDGAVAEQSAADTAYADLARGQAATTPCWPGIRI